MDILETPRMLKEGLQEPARRERGKEQCCRGRQGTGGRGGGGARSTATWVRSLALVKSNQKPDTCDKMEGNSKTSRIRPTEASKSDFRLSGLKFIEDTEKLLFMWLIFIGIYYIRNERRET